MIKLAKPLQDLFTDQSIARLKDGIIYQIMLHLMKLQYKFDWERDARKHMNDILTWLNELYKAIRKDDKTKSSITMMKEFIKLHPNLDHELTKDLKKKYPLRSKLTLADITLCTNIPIWALVYAAKNDKELDKQKIEEEIIYAMDLPPIPD